MACRQWSASLHNRPDRAACAALKLRATSHSCYIITGVRPGHVLGLAGPHLRPTGRAGTGRAGPGFRPDQFQGANWPESYWPIRSGERIGLGAKRLGTNYFLPVSVRSICSQYSKDECCELQSCEHKSPDFWNKSHTPTKPDVNKLKIRSSN